MSGAENQRVNLPAGAGGVTGLQHTEANLVVNGMQAAPQSNRPAAAAAPIVQAALPGSELVKLQRSFHFSSNDRYDQEQYIMQPLTVPGQDIKEEKAKILGLNPQIVVIPNSTMYGKLRIDGIYCDKDPTTYQRFNDSNVVRLEQRILRETPFVTALEKDIMKDVPKTAYFKMNGDLKLHNDLLADEITRPADLAFEQSEAYQTKEVNAILSDRMHSYKKRYFRLDIIVGKLALHGSPQYFSIEDRLALELRELYKEWERRTSLALIPFFMERLKFMEDEQYKRHREGGNQALLTKEDGDFLTRNIEETQRKLEQEKREVQELATQLYKKWKEIKDLRAKNMFASTNVKLKVHKLSNGELYFNLLHEEPSAKQVNGAALPSSEVSRRNSAVRVRAFIRLIINGRYVARSRKQFLKWPSLEIEVSEQFQVCLFTMPSSIQLEIVIDVPLSFKEILIDVIDLEVPGSYVKALTSAATLIKEIPFSKLAFDMLRETRHNAPKSEATMTEEQKVEEKKKQAEDLKKARESDWKGLMYVKAEWKGEGPEMPPLRSENVFRQPQPQKNRKDYSEEEQRRMLLRQLYIDVNDPRNERIIKFLKETKNEFLLKLLREDAKNPNFHLKPFRHMLLEARAKDSDLAKTQIPLLESEVISSSHLLDKLEVLFREYAYREYLEKKIEDERTGISSSDDPPKVYNLDLETNAIKFDSECIRRRQMFFDKLKHFQREIQSGGHSKAANQYKSVVREFELLESENPLLALFNKMFLTGRKLKPVVQKRPPVSYEAVKEAKILVHIVKGFNVPIRRAAKQQILSNYQRQNQSAPMNPYGGGNVGPFAATPQQLQMNQGFGGGGGLGNTGMDLRTSYIGGNNPGMSGGFQQTGYGNERFNGMVPLNNQSMRQHTQKGDIRQLSEEQLKQIYRTQRVEPLIEVRIVYNEDYSEVKLTNNSEGDFPEWNEILEFPLKPINKRRFTKQELVSTKSMIYVTLFDREISISNTGRVEVEQNLRYLGSFSIPLIALLNNPPKIDAIFKVNRPIALFNYQVETETFFFLNHDPNKEQPAEHEIPNTYISMSISLDPVLELTQENELEYYIGREKQTLLSAGSEWVKTMRRGKFEKRNIKVYGENVSGQSVLLSRYILPQTPPPDIYDYKNLSSKTDSFAIEKAARYVSLIPMIEDNQYFNGMPDLWCTSQEFLDMGAGDVEEHAILLCNFFNFIDQHQGRGENFESYVMLGIGYPEGRSAYVMRRDKRNNHVELWNPLRGEAYFFGREDKKETVLGCINVSSGFMMNKRVNDAICQLKSVGCVIGRDNVWANVQEFDDPGLINFNIDLESCWNPFLTSKNRSKYFPGGAQIESEQIAEIRYMKPMEKERADLIAIKIQNYITEQFESQRIKDNRMRTKWNNQMEAILNNILAKLEMKRKKARQGANHSSLRSDGVVDEDVQQQIIAIEAQINANAKGMKSWGFPINVTFVNLPMLWEEVKNTKIHLVFEEDAEFSLYVYVEPYSHNVLSVWFYLLALTKNKAQLLGPSNPGIY